MPNRAGDADTSLRAWAAAARPPVLDAALLACFVCAAFAAAASLLVLWHSVAGGFPDGRAFAARVAIKTVAFAILASAAVYALWRRRPRGENATALPAEGATWGLRCALALTLLVAAALVFPNLDVYPWIAPDESHHLVVARNLAEFGLYASGHPDAGFTLFDTYDSVGAPVIIPVAAAFRAFGVSLTAARVVIGLFMLGLMLAAYHIAKPVFGSGAAVCCAAMMPMTQSSVYLSRTLYGEVPALCFLFLGLAAWGRALGARRGYAWGISAGVCFALAVLAKTIVVLSAFAFLGALLYDAFGYRRVRVRHVAAPVAGFALVAAAWWGYRASAQVSPAESLERTLAWYQHFLLFGIGCAGKNVRTLCAQPWMLLGAIAGPLAAIPVFFRRRYSPPAIVVFLFAALFLFWWVFFTPGDKPRYLWMSLIAAGLFTGALIWLPLRVLHLPGPRLSSAAAAMALLLLFAGPPVYRTAQRAWRVCTLDEMRDDWAAAAYVKDLAPDAKVATTFYPLERTLNFLAHRYVPKIADLAAAAAPYDIVIVDARTQEDLLAGKKTVRFGRYAAVVMKE